MIAAGGGHDLAWPYQRVAAELLSRSGARPVHLLLHGGARGAHQLGWCSLVLPAELHPHGRAAGAIRNRELLELAVPKDLAHASPMLSTSVLLLTFPGGSGTASLVHHARRMASRSPVPLSVVDVMSAHPPVSGPRPLPSHRSVRLANPPAPEASRAHWRC